MYDCMKDVHVCCVSMSLDPRSQSVGGKLTLIARVTFCLVSSNLQNTTSKREHSGDWTGLPLCAHMCIYKIYINYTHTIDKEQWGNFTKTQGLYLYQKYNQGYPLQ